MDAKFKIRRGLDNIYDRYPFFASIAAQWRVIADEKVRTAATDGKALYYNPKFINYLNIAETTDVLLHELGHIFLGHHLRFKGKDARLWNEGADLALNDYIMRHYEPTGKIRELALFPGERREARVDPVLGPLSGYDFTQFPRNKDAEWYYVAVNAQQKEEQRKDREQGVGNNEYEDQDEGDGASADSDEGDEGQSNSDGDEGEDEQEAQGSQMPRQGSEELQDDSKGSQQSQESSDESEEQDEPQDGSGGGGSASGSQGPEQYDGPMRSLGEILPYPDTDDEEKMEEAEREWEQAVARGINDAKACGDLPGWMRELAENLYGKKSKVDWRQVLRRFLTKYAPTRYSFNKPNRKTAWRRDLIQPGRHSREASPGAVLVDVSGSMHQIEMNLGISEIENVLKVYQRCEVDLWMADTRMVGEKRNFKRWDFPLHIPHEWLGRGGTDLTAAIAQIAKDRKYKWLVILTDAEWSYHTVENPGIPTIWLFTRDHRYGQPKFGQVIKVEVPQS